MTIADLPHVCNCANHPTGSRGAAFKPWLNAALPDEATWEAQELLATVEGVFVEPAAALAVAAIRADAASGRLGSSDRPCAVLSGNGLKDLRRFTGSPSAGTVAVDQLPTMVHRYLAAGEGN